MTMRPLTTLLTGALLLSAPIANATVWRVNNNPALIQGTGSPQNPAYCANCFDNLQAAANSQFVLDYDTLHLEPSPNTYGNLALTKRLVIIGPGYWLGQGTTNNAGLQANTRTAMIHQLDLNPGTGGSPGASGSKITGCVIGDGTANGGIDINNVNNIALDRNLYRRSVSFDVSGINGVTITRSYFDGGAGIGTPANNQTVGNVMITNNYFSGSISLDPTFSNVTIAHNLFNWNGTLSPYGAEVKNNIFRQGGISQNDNNIHHNIAAGATSLPGSEPTNHNSVNMASGVFNPAYSSDDLKWTLLPSWTYFDDGEFGTQPGMYGGAMPYLASGIPAIPAVYQLSAPATAVQGSSINVTLGTRSND